MDAIQRAVGCRQLGVSVRDGMAVHYHAVSAYNARIAVSSSVEEKQDECQGSSRVRFSVDFQNAFNSISRRFVLEQVYRRLPSFYGYFVLQYAAHSFLRCHDGTLIESQSGVLQGDAAGPLGFCIGLEAFLERLQTLRDQLDLESWFMDDGAIGGQTDVLSQIAEFIDTHGPDVGLRLKASKCEITLHESVATPDWAKWPAVKECSACNARFTWPGRTMSSPRYGR